MSYEKGILTFINESNIHIVEVESKPISSVSMQCVREGQSIIPMLGQQLVTARCIPS